MREIEVTFTFKREITRNTFVTMMVPVNLIPSVGDYIKFPMIEDLDEMYKVLDVVKMFYGDDIALEIAVG